MEPTLLNSFLILIFFVLQHPVIQECWEDTTLWTFHRTGIHRQTFTVGGLQIWLAHLCSCDIMWSFKNIHIQWRISENEYRQIRQSCWRQPGELKLLILKNLCKLQNHLKLLCHMQDMINYIWAIFARHKICENKVTGLFFLKFLKENNNGYNFCLILLYFLGM